MDTRAIPGPRGPLAITTGGTGDRLPAVFLHADAGRADQWRQQLTEEATRRPVAALDFRGHGASAPAGDGDYGFEGRAADLGALAAALALRRFVIVAHSGGGAVALSYAASHGDRVAGIVLADPPTDPRAMPQSARDKFVADLAGPASLEALRAFYGSIVGANEATRQRVLADVELVHPDARAGVGRALAEWNPEPTLRAFTGPMLILVTAPNDNPAGLHRLRRDVPHRLVPDAGHWLQMDQPRIVGDAIAQFIEAVEDGSRVRRD